MAITIQTFQDRNNTEDTGYLTSVPDYIALRYSTHYYNVTRVNGPGSVTVYTYAGEAIDVEWRGMTHTTAKQLFRDLTDRNPPYDADDWLKIEDIEMRAIPGGGWTISAHILERSGDEET